MEHTVGGDAVSTHEGSFIPLWSERSHLHLRGNNMICILATHLHPNPLCFACLLQSGDLCYPVTLVLAGDPW